MSAQPRCIRLCFVEPVEHGKEHRRCVLERSEVVDVFVLEPACEFFEQVIRAFAVWFVEGGEKIGIDIFANPLFGGNAEIIDGEGGLLLRQGH